MEDNKGNSNRVIFIIVCVVVVLALFLGYKYYVTQNQLSHEEAIKVISIEEADIVVSRTDDGYEPKEITVSKGTVVVWVNESGEFHWPASNIHPTHGIYPEFDPRRPVAPGDSWGFVFDKAGEWRYHDHLRANSMGVVTVTE
jgi:plastocyanin